MKQMRNGEEERGREEGMVNHRQTKAERDTGRQRQRGSRT